MADRLLVIGGDAAGMSAAMQVRRRQPDREIVVLEKGRWTSYSACGIPFLVGGSVGVATTDDPAMDVLGLLAQADLDMYRNKRRSDGQRSRLTRATDPAPPRPAFEPLCSLSLQGAATTPTGGWPGVYWSSTPVDGAPSVLRESPLR